MATLKTDSVLQDNQHSHPGVNAGREKPPMKFDQWFGKYCFKYCMILLLALQPNWKYLQRETKREIKRHPDSFENGDFFLRVNEA